MAAITRTNITAIRNDVEAALRTIYAKHGVDVTVGRITFNADSFRCKIEGVVRAAAVSPNSPNVATAPVNPQALALKKKGYLLNAAGAAFDETKEYIAPSLGRIKVVGFNAKAKKYPFIVQVAATGKRYKFTTLSVKGFVANGAVA